MKHATMAAAVFFLALFMIVYFVTMRYQVLEVDGLAYRLDRWTGTVAICTQWDDNSLSCANAPELYHKPGKNEASK
jgi:hypothetical protein